MNNVEFNRQVLLSKLAEMEECSKNIENSSNVFDSNLTLTKGLGFFDACSINEMYDKFKDLNSFPKEYNILLKSYIDEVRNAANESYERELDVLS